ncbi:MAG TPA: AsmA family protein [Balneolaceae bacterium]|nr:AsmA family protein [Balneolaceae bacterium]
MRVLLYIFGIIVVIVVIGFIVLSFTVDGMVKSGIEEVGSEMLQTQVDVDDVSISILDGTGTIEGIAVQNPEGFSDSAAIKLQSIHLSLDLSSLLSDTVVIDTIIISQPMLFFEQKANGAVNLRKLTENIDMTSSSEGGMIIDYLRVDEGLVKLSTEIGEGRQAQVKFDEIVLADIGRTGSNTVEQTVRQILEPIIERAIQQAIKEGLLEQAKDKLQNILDL